MTDKIINMSLKEALNRFPELKSNLPKNIDFNDPFYVVRYNPILKFFELGYETDDWLLVN